MRFADREHRVDSQQFLDTKTGRVFIRQPKPQDEIITAGFYKIEGTVDDLTEFAKLQSEHLTPRLVDGAQQGLGKIQNLPEFDLERKAIERAMRIPKKHQYAVECALVYCREIAQELGIPNSSLPEIVFLDRRDYQDTELGGRGEYVGLLQTPFVEYDKNLPIFELASTAFHEYVHQLIDFQPIFFSTHLDEESKTFTWRFIVSRTGAEVYQVRQTPIPTDEEDYDDSLVEQDGELRNTFLNELGNHAWEREFVKRLMQDSRYRSENQSEVAQFEKLVKWLERHPEYVVPCEGFRVRFFSENLAYAGKESPVSVDTILFQLYDELSHFFGEVDGHDLKYWLLQLKRDARTHRLLQRQFNEVLGPGFYARLRRVSHDDYGWLSLLDWLQQHRPPHADTVPAPMAIQRLAQRVAQLFHLR